MSQFSFRLPRAYRLKPVAQREDDALSLLRIGASNKSVLVPFSPGLDYVIASKAGAELPIRGDDFRVEMLGALPSLWAQLRLALLFKKKKYLKYDEFSLFSVGPKFERKRFTKYNQGTMNIGVVADSDLAARHPELLYGWPAEVSPAPRVIDRSGGVPVAVVAHIYYEDTWPDIAGALRGLTIPYDLIVTTVAGRERLVETIRRTHPRAEIEIVENCGRDVGPFMLLLERGRLDGYRYVCKISRQKIDGWRPQDLHGGYVAASAAL